MNIRVIDGRLTKDAEVKVDKSGMKYLSFTLVHNAYSKNTQTAIFFNVTSYNAYDINAHETDNKYAKGRLVVVIGKASEVMTIKDNKTYLNRSILAHYIEVCYVPKEDGKQVTSHVNVAPTTPTPTCETPTLSQPTVSTPTAPSFSAEIPVTPVVTPVTSPITPTSTNKVYEVGEPDELPF